MDDDFKSPLPKKLKDESVTKSYALEPNQLSEAPSLNSVTNEFLDKLYNKAIFQQKLENEVKDLADKCLSVEQDLDRLRIERLEKVTQELPLMEITNVNEILKNLGITMEELKNLSKSDNARIKKACDHIMVLSILEAKRNCPISQIVDNL